MVLFNKRVQHCIRKKMDTSVLIFIWKCQEDADSLIRCHEKGLYDDDKNVRVAVIYTQWQNCVNVHGYGKFLHDLRCLCIPASLSVYPSVYMCCHKIPVIDLMSV